MKNDGEQVQVKELIRELVRSDLNLERWGLFAPRRYPYKSRRLVKYEKGIRSELIIGVMPDGTEVGVLDADDGKTFYAILKLWEEQGKPDSGRVIFKIRHLLKKLGIKKISKRIYEIVKKHIENLSAIPLYWINSYITNGIPQTEERFNLLDNVSLFGRIKGINKPYFGFSEVKINEVVLESLKSKYVKPIRLDVLREFKSDLALLLYRWLDRTLYGVKDYDTYKRDLREVAKICGIEEQPMYKIKWKIQKAIKELEGKEITRREGEGIIKNIRIEKSDTPSGWKLVVEKWPLPRTQVIDVIDHIDHPELPEVQIPPEQELAKELVLYFHGQLGHKDLDGKVVKPTSLEMSQAAGLIKEYGFEWSKEFVDYVIDQIQERRTTVHVFGYVSHLLNDFKKHKAEEEKRKREKEEEQYRKSQLSKLPEMIYQKLYEEIKSRLLLEYKGDTYILASLEGRTYPDAGQKAVEEEMIKVIKTFPVVTLQYVNSHAQNVAVAGDWNSWDPEPMERKDDGIWFKEIRLPTGVYKYKFVVDGVWISDPDGQSANDEFGNSLLKLV